VSEKDKLIPFGDRINRKDLDIILEVNRKAVEIETTVADQNEEIIDLLEKTIQLREKSDDKLNTLLKNSTEHSKDLFRIQVLFVTGILALVARIIRIFLRK
jgi:hypothetical protein